VPPISWYGCPENVPRTIAFQVTDEQAIALEQARRDASAASGVEVSMSMLMRTIVESRLLPDLAPFDAGWAEGLRMGYGAVMRVCKTAVHDLATDGIPAEDTAEVFAGAAG